MKQRLIFFTGLLSVLFFACAEKEVVPEIIIDSATSTTVEMSHKPGVSVSFPFTSTVDWCVECSDKKDVSVTPASGKAGKQSVNIKMVTANQTSKERTFTVRLKLEAEGATSTSNRTITLKQPAAFVLEKDLYTVNPEGDQLSIVFETPLEREEVTCWYDNTFAEMIGEGNKSSRSSDLHSCVLPLTRAANNRLVLTLDILPNETGRLKEGIFFFADKSVSQQKLDDPASLVSEIITVSQNPMDSGTSTDFSADGRVSVLQKHTQGKQGVPIILMGDAFIDKDIANGVYDAVMKDAMEKLFTIEPMTSLREYFDVYRVNAVSKNNIVSSTTSTAFSTEFHAGSTEITGDDDKCWRYALKAIDKKREHDALVLVIINDSRYAGTCSLSITSDVQNGVPSGISIAYIPMVENSKVPYEQVLHHEAVGHGLGKLDDEYGSEENYRQNGNILDDNKKDGDGKTPLDILKMFQRYYALLNVTLESDVLKTPWSEFYKDERYAAEKLGAYEGASTYPYGIYRPTDNSLMRSGSKLNVVGRSLIYKRVMSIANEYDWRFNYEKFVEFDEPSRKTTKAMPTTQPSVQLKHHARPRLVLVK